MAGKSKVEVRINGKDYTIIGSEPDEYIQRVALYIDKKMNEITRANSKLSTAMTAVLTAINVGDEYFKALECIAELKGNLKEACTELERLKRERSMLAEENALLKEKNTELQFEIVKRETELNDVINNVQDRRVRPKGGSI